MGKKLAVLLQEAYDKGFDKGYRKAYREACDFALKTAHSAFCVSMNKNLSIGADRMEKVEDLVLHYLAEEFIKDPELTYSRLTREYQRITGIDIDQKYIRGTEE